MEEAFKIIKSHENPVIQHLHKVLLKDVEIRPLSEIKKRVSRDVIAYIIGNVVYVSEEVKDPVEIGRYLLHEAFHFIATAPDEYIDIWNEFYHEILAFCIEDIFIYDRLTEDRLREIIQTVNRCYELDIKIRRLPIDVRFIMDEINCFLEKSRAKKLMATNPI